MERTTVKKTTPDKVDDKHKLSYTLPQTFKIGGRYTEAPLVTSSQLKGHLALLHAFAQLRAKVEGIDVGEWKSDRYIPDKKDKRWVWFVGFAVERFEIWAASLTPEDADRNPLEFLPPLDVLMVWHTYMLNPCLYAEDCTRLPILKGLAAAEHLLIVALVHPELKQFLNDDPTMVRAEFWKSKAKTRSFDALDDAHEHQTKAILCPLCQRVKDVPFITLKGNGYLQDKFQITCCRREAYNDHYIRTDILVLRKFAEDLVREDGTPRSYFAGTLRTPHTPADLTRARRIKDDILSSSSFLRPPGNTINDAWIKSIIEKCHYGYGFLDTLFPLKMREAQKPLIDRILEVYGVRGPFSVDLVGAVIRQGSFIQKMEGLGWTEPAFFDSPGDELPLEHSVARYHGFLDLMSSSPSSFLVPTLDIDLAWHTHQLMGERYNADCLKFVGRFVDHNDKVEENKLSTSFDDTSRAWNDRFKVPYTHCGCPPPGDKIGQRLSHLIHFNNAPKVHLIPPARGDVLAATHPSEHNSFVHGNAYRSDSMQAQYDRKQKIAKRVARDAKRTSVANADGVSVQSSEKDNKLREAPDSRSYEHTVPFMIPVPYTNSFDPACAAHSGHVDTKSGRCYDSSIAACASMPKPYVYVPPPPRTTTGRGGKSRSNGGDGGGGGGGDVGGGGMGSGTGSGAGVGGDGGGAGAGCGGCGGGCGGCGGGGD